jgi:hypothetical protein
MGLCEVGRRRVEWSLLFDIPGRVPAQRAKPIDGQLPRSLIELPRAITGALDIESYRSLAIRDLVRGEGTGLPSGESVAALMGAEILSDEEVGLRAYDWEAQTPLWLYVLREASLRHAVDRLGDVGGRIVGEVLIGIIARDPESYLALEPDWQPTLPRHVPERFQLCDILVPAHD